MNAKVKKILNYLYVFVAGVGTILLILLGRSLRHDSSRNNTGIDTERDRIDGSINSIDRGLTELTESNISTEEIAGDTRELHSELSTDNSTIERVRLEIATTNREIERSNLTVTDRLQRSKDLSERNIQLLRELQKRISSTDDQD